MLTLVRPESSVSVRWMLGPSSAWLSIWLASSSDRVVFSPQSEADRRFAGARRPLRLRTNWGLGKVRWMVRSPAKTMKGIDSMARITPVSASIMMGGDACVVGWWGLMGGGCVCSPCWLWSSVGGRVSEWACALVVVRDMNGWWTAGSKLGDGGV